MELKYEQMDFHQTLFFIGFIVVCLSFHCWVITSWEKENHIQIRKEVRDNWVDVYIHLVILYYIYKPTKVYLVIWQTHEEIIHVCLNSFETKVENKNSLKCQYTGSMETVMVILLRMWLLKFRFGFYCILLTVIVHRGSFLTWELEIMSTPQNWICFKITVSGMKNGVCAFFSKMWPFERSTFLAGESGSEFLEGHLFNSLSNVVGHWFMTVLWLSLPA